MSTVATASPSAAPASSNPSPPRAGRPSHPRPTTYTGLSPTIQTSNELPVSSNSQNYSNSMNQPGPPIAPPPRTSSQRQATTAPSAAPGGSTERSRSASGRTRGQSTDGREREKSERDRDRDRRRTDESSKSRKDLPVGRSNSARDPTRNGATSNNTHQQPVEQSPNTRRRQEGADGASGSASGGSRNRGNGAPGGSSSGLAVVNTPDGPGRSTGTTRKETRFGEYILGQTLGEGEFGKVKLGWRRDGGVQVLFNSFISHSFVSLRKGEKEGKY